MKNINKKMQIKLNFCIFTSFFAYNVYDSLGDRSDVLSFRFISDLP